MKHRCPKCGNRFDANAIVQHHGLYRAKLSCRIGRDAIEGKTNPPDGCTPTEYALYNMLHAIEEIADALFTNNRNLPDAGQRRATTTTKGNKS